MKITTSIPKPSKNDSFQPPFLGKERENLPFSTFRYQKAGNPKIQILVKINTIIAINPAFNANPVITEILGAIATKNNPQRANF